MKCFRCQFRRHKIDVRRTQESGQLIDGNRLIDAGPPGETRYDYANDLALLIEANDAEPGHLIARHRQHGDGDVGLGVRVCLEEMLEIHAIELIAGQD